MGATSEMQIQMQDQLFSLINSCYNGSTATLDTLIALRERKQIFEECINVIREFETEKMQSIENEAANYPDGYKGYEIKVVSGRRIFNFKDIPEVIEAEKEVIKASENKKKIENTYKLRFEATEKGIAYANISADGEELPLPTVDYSRGYVTLKQKR